MIKYQVSLNKGVEAFGTGPSITANEIVDTADASALAREIHHLNSLIPEQVAEAVLQNFCEAAANLMAMGYAVVLRSGADAAIRIYPDVHVKGGNINLDRAKQLIPGTAADSIPILPLLSLAACAALIILWHRRASHRPAIPRSAAAA